MDEEQQNEPIELLDDSDWRSPVTDRVAAPSSSAPELLPFHERSWTDFERIILVIAEHIDGLRGVRLYGVPGQLQKGIDLYGTDANSRLVAYQPKRHVTFEEHDLEDAVNKFDRKDRAVGATKLVVAVACLTDRTEMSEKLVELKRTHPDVEIDLYD